MTAGRMGLMLVAVTWLGLAASAWAQPDDDRAADAGTDATTGDQEVGVSEENYRRHMELGDIELQRNNFPVTDYAGQAELQKMGRLPEASQRHLRDQLRDQIMQLGAWSPAQTPQDHPFVPSAAARGDGELRRLESEAWEELVTEYQAREAELQAGAGRAGHNGTTADAAQSGDAARSGAAGDLAPESIPLDALAGAPGKAGRAAAATPSGQPPGTDPATRGASQSALDFLTGSNGSNGSSGSSGQDPATAVSPPLPGSASGAQAEQAMTAQTTAPAVAPEATAGGSQQNAAERLAAGAPPESAAAGEAQAATPSQAPAQPADPASETAQSQDTDASKASEQAESVANPDIEYREQEGVLVIRELRNARGVVPVVAEPDDEEGEKQDPDEQP